MKRLIIIASLAMLAVGCQKTEIQNEVQTPIGFSTEVGKQTRAIVSNTYDPNQPFAVYAYGHQGNAAATTVMNNVEVSYTAASGEGTEAIPAKWSATGTTKYYWPNDPTTTLNFYAYSPAQPKSGNPDTEKAAHQELTGTISHTEAAGLKLTDYVHSNMYVDFMVATPVLGATYSNPDGNDATPTTEGAEGSIPVDFKHKMTQVNFTVKIADNVSYPDVDFKINSIVLNNIVSNGTYQSAVGQTEESWGAASTPATASYKIYPATTASVPSEPTNGDNGYSYGEPALTNADSETTEVTVILETDAETPTTKTNPGRSFSTTPVTMIPQSWNATAGREQSVTVSYTISGTGVATETVTKTFKFAEASTTAPTWGINKNVRYTLTISLHEITFTPSVSNWDDETTGYYVDPAVPAV